MIHTPHHIPQHPLENRVHIADGTTNQEACNDLSEVAHFMSGTGWMVT